MSARLAVIGVLAAFFASSCDSEGAVVIAGPVGVSAGGAAGMSPGDRPLGEYLSCLRDAGVTSISAHRGGPGRGRPENAMGTFQTTLDAAPVLLEVDVRATSDGVLVLFHDEELSPRSTCDGALEDRRFDTLTGCRLTDYRGQAGSERLARLDDLLAWAPGRTVLQLDVKELSLMEDVVDAVRAADAENDVILITYTPRAAERAARLDPDIMISATVQRPSDLDRLENAGVDLSRVLAWTGTEAPDAALYATIRRRGAFVIFGTLGRRRSSIDGAIERAGDDGRYADIVANGVDVLATDRPIAAYRAIHGGVEAHPALAACRR